MEPTQRESPTAPHEPFEASPTAPHEPFAASPTAPHEPFAESPGASHGPSAASPISSHTIVDRPAWLDDVRGAPAAKRSRRAIWLIPAALIIVGVLAIAAIVAANQLDGSGSSSASTTNPAGGSSAGGSEADQAAAILAEPETKQAIKDLTALEQVAEHCMGLPNADARMCAGVLPFGRETAALTWTKQPDPTTAPRSVPAGEVAVSEQRGKLLLYAGSGHDRIWAAGIAEPGATVAPESRMCLTAKREDCAGITTWPGWND